MKHFWASCRELLLGTPTSLHPTAAGFHTVGQDSASPQHAGAGSAQCKGWPVLLGDSPGAERPLPACVAEGFSQTDLTNCQKWSPVGEDIFWPDKRPPCSLVPELLAFLLYRCCPCSGGWHSMAEVSCPHVTQLPQGLGQVEVFRLRDCGNEGAE